jgi:hypothetical protein
MKTQWIIFGLLFAIIKAGGFSQSMNEEPKYSMIEIKIQRPFHRALTILLKKELGVDLASVTSFVYSKTEGAEWDGLDDRIFQKIPVADFTKITARMESLNLFDLYKNYPVIMAGDSGSWSIKGWRWGSSFSYTFDSPEEIALSENFTDFVKDMMKLGKVYEVYNEPAGKHRRPKVMPDGAGGCIDTSGNDIRSKNIMANGLTAKESGR